MLKQQHHRLVASLREMYRRLLRAGAWDSKLVQELDGRPSVHDLLSTLGVLELGEEEHDFVQPRKFGRKSVQVPPIATWHALESVSPSGCSFGDLGSLVRSRSRLGQQMQGAPEAAVTTTIAGPSFEVLPTMAYVDETLPPNVTQLL